MINFFEKVEVEVPSHEQQHKDLKHLFAICTIVAVIILIILITL